MRNIVFIGLPGCGKTTVSSLVAQALRAPWYDSDAEIEKSEGMRVSEIFARRGEACFRAAERACVERLAALNGAVIALGGGAVLQNGETIKNNAVVIYLRRSVGDILATLEPGTRPLLKDPGNLERLFLQRGGLYEALCDVAVDSGQTVEETAKRVLEALK